MSDAAHKPVPKPVPSPAPESVRYWQAVREHRLELPRCNACGKFWFPPSQSCPLCLKADFAWTPVSGVGKPMSSKELLASMPSGIDFDSLEADRRGGGDDHRDRWLDDW